MNPINVLEHRDLFFSTLLLLFVGFGIAIFTSISSDDKIKRIFSISAAQTSVIAIFTISGTRTFFLIQSENIGESILHKNEIDPLIQVLMLTAIVVGFSTSSLLLALAIKSKEGNVV